MVPHSHLAAGAVVNLEGALVPFVTSLHVFGTGFMKNGWKRQRLDLIVIVSEELTEQLQIFIAVSKHCWSEVRLIWSVSEVASHWESESWRSRCRGGRKPRGALLALASVLGSVCQRLLKLSLWLAQTGKKILSYLVLYLLFLLNAQLATSRWPLVKPRGLTPVCGSEEPRRRTQPSQSETE